MRKNLFLFLWMGTTAIAAERPNILLITVPNLGRDWVSCYGASQDTPHIDRLASQGVRYETAWSTPAAIPSRVTLLTGRYPCHHGWTDSPDPSLPSRGLRPDAHFSFVQQLRDSGYATAIGGTWGLGAAASLREHGFDEHCIWPQDGAGFWQGEVVTNGRRTKAAYVPDAIHQFLAAFIQRHQKKPFLAYYPVPLTQKPFSTTPLNRDHPPTGNSARFAGTVDYVDALVGRLVKVVDDLGVAPRTLIVFAGSSGSELAGTLHGKPYLRGRGSPADPGAHVPFIVRAPFLTRSTGACLDLVDFTDLCPTLLELAQLAPPASARLDGKSFIPSLRGSEDPFQKRSWIFSQLGSPRMIRDWHHVLDSGGGFHDLRKDPLQQAEVSPLDKIAPGRRQRLEMILKRFPPDAVEP